MSIKSSIEGQAAEETQIVGVPGRMVGFPFHTDDDCVLIHVDGKGQADASSPMIDDTIDEEGDICYEFAHA